MHSPSLCALHSQASTGGGKPKLYVVDATGRRVNAKAKGVMAGKSVVYALSSVSVVHCVVVR